MIEKTRYFKLKEDLQKYLHQKTNYSYNNLKEHLELENDDDFFYLLCKILQESLERFNFETPVFYNKYLFKCTNYLNENNIEINNKKYFVETLTKLKKQINTNIMHNKSNTNIAISNKTFLLSLSSEINSSLAKIKYDKDDIDVNENEAYYLLKELVFDIKNPIYIEEILENYPNLILSKKNNRFLFEDIYDKYLNILLNSNDEYELLYYDKLIQVFINNSNNNDDIKYIVINKMDKLLSSLDRREISNEKKFKIKFFLEEIKNIYNLKSESKEKKISKLNIKYNLTRISEIGNFKLVKPSWKDYKESNRYILTFDDPNAKTLENAISLELSNDGKIFFKYYVIDVDSFVDEYSELEHYIYNNAMSIKGFHMFPKDIRNKMSFKEGKRKKAIAYIFEFDSLLNVTNFRVEKQNIKVKHCLKFSDVKTIMNYPVETKLKRVVTNMYAFSKYIAKNQEDKKQYHEIKEISKKILFNDIYTEKNRGAKMMSDFTIFVNSYISDYCNNHNLPYLFRNNEFNRSIELIDELKSKYQGQEDLQDILSFIYATYEPSNYSPINKGHAGLNLPAYGEVTKPTRSYASLMNQRLVNKYFIDGLVLNDDSRQKLINELNKICVHLNKKRIIYDNYVYEVNKVLKKTKK